ncbi:hypothetical protein R1T16_05675 [Flavobacterium sp. DG1-102-2]|uniref:hypothetical protein n=1 Tax=Flavobacterium sp. DG1-102-2 TaxID=3081663 RepID=UPI00294999A5|nr:hypothetical protein [Flavobacterium sp. DG1-102-2]MDV6167905.1 hypothetical protein [Flavobacterium sp. DG1-102-2]
MSLIRIFANGIELDIVIDTLNIRKENNAFSTDFSISHSSYPFLIVENEKTQRALGTRDLTSVIKKKIIPVTVFEMGEEFNGELQVLTYSPGFRKCNIKYGVEPLAIMNAKLLDILPVLSVIPNVSTPVPFTEESLQVIYGTSFWETYPNQFVGKIYPQAKFQFPQMAWKNKFSDEAPEADDPWFEYKGYYNFYQANHNFAINNYTITGALNDNVSVFNRNVPSPQLFLLGILDYAFASIGWKIAGDFVSNEFIKRLLVLSTKNNLCKVVIAPASQVFSFTDLILRSNVNFAYDYYMYEHIPTSAGTYTFQYNITDALRPDGITNTAITKLVWQLDAIDVSVIDGEVYANYNDPANLHFEGSFDVVVDEEKVGKRLRVFWMQLKAKPFIAPAYTLQWTKDGKDYQMMHPTLQLGRYAPEGTLSDYINEVKNTFALNLKFDSVSKMAYFNFTAKSLIKADQYAVQKSLAITEYEPPENVAVVLKYANEEDTSLYIDKNGVTLNQPPPAEFGFTIESKFKLVPREGQTADLSTIDDKEGTGLMIYAPSGTAGFELPVITDTYNGQTLTWDGAQGLYNMFHKNVVRFRLNASKLEIEGPFTETEIAMAARVFKIHVDNQTYIITGMEYEPTKQGNYNVKFTLESLNF